MLAALTSSGMMASCWASNVWPGAEDIWHAALGRLIWWAAPFALIVWINGAPLEHSLWLGAAAWVGAWVPHVPLPDVDNHWAAVLMEIGITLLRTLAMLAPPAGVFYLCGAYWQAMVLASMSTMMCIKIAHVAPHRWVGLRSGRDVAGVLFGASVGFWLAVAVWTPTPTPDLLP